MYEIHSNESWGWDWRVEGVKGGWEGRLFLAMISEIDFGHLKC